MDYHRDMAEPDKYKNNVEKVKRLLTIKKTSRKSMKRIIDLHMRIGMKFQSHSRRQPC